MISPALVLSAWDAAFRNLHMLFSSWDNTENELCNNVTIAVTPQLAGGIYADVSYISLQGLF